MTSSFSVMITFVEVLSCNLRPVLCESISLSLSLLFAERGRRNHHQLEESGQQRVAALEFLRPSSGFR